MNEQSQKLMVGPDEPISNQEAGFLGLQHVLAMDVYVPRYHCRFIGDGS